MKKTLWGFISALVLLGSIGLLAGSASAENSEEFCDTDVTTHYLYRGTTRSMKVVSTFTGCVGQRFVANANGTNGEFLCSFIWGFTQSHRNTRLSGNVSMVRGWSDAFTSHIPQTTNSSCSLIGNGHGGEFSSRNFWVNARYRNNRTWPIPDQYTTPNYWVSHTASTGTGPIDYTQPGAVEGIIRVVHEPDWKFGRGVIPVQISGGT